MLALLVAVLDVHGDQVGHQGRALRLRGVAQVVLEARPLPGLPGRLEAVAGGVHPRRQRRRFRLPA
jgi:hypothetical protein